MRTAKVLFVLALVASGSTNARVQDAPRSSRIPPPENYSPLGFYDLRAYEQAYPGEPGSALVLQADSQKYWAFRGVAYRGLTPSGGAWTSLGPETTLQTPNNNAQKTVSGRVSALVISQRCGTNRRSGACRLWVGTAGGGVWRTDDAMNTVNPGWQWISRGLGTNNIGSLALDPNDRLDNTIYVGTGETNTPHNSGAGTGLYRSSDGGQRWTRISTMITDPAVQSAPIDFTSTRGIGAIAIHPTNSKIIYVATTSAMLGMTGVRGGQTQTTGYPQPRAGLYKTDNGGTTWTLLWVPPLDPVIPVNPNLGVGIGDTMFGVRDVQLDPRNPSIVYATAFNNAIHRSAPSIEGGDASFKPVFAIVGLQRFRDLAMFDLVPLGRRSTRIYVYNGTENQAAQGLYRLDTAEQPAAALVTGQGAGLTNTSAWISLTSNSTTSPASTSRSICGSQCFYDLVVASPDREPNTVLVGGQLHPDFGEPTIRSTNAGATFSMYGFDAQNPSNDSHVDVRSIAFHPRDPRIVFVGSDGGVVRTDGRTVNLSGSCAALFPGRAQCATAVSAVPNRIYFMNQGLQTMQFYNVAVDPQAPLTRLLGGLQDNGTIWQDGSNNQRVWKALFPSGDGTSASGFHPTRSDVLFASFQSNSFFTNFRNGDLSRWARTSRPIQDSGERATISASTGRQFITFDQAAPDTQFTGFQHIWRTQNNGGPQAFLEANCVTGNSAACGDWVPLGVTFPFPAGSTPASASRKPGDLTSDFYGADRAGGMIVAAERSPADAGTLWAATNFGRLFIAKNANVAGNAVTFVRLDGGVMPNRLVTRIAADPANANVAYISYSGFNALTPGSPGHVFRAVFNPATLQATFTMLDFDLGDLPINTIAYDSVRGDLYAGTDFGPLRLPSGTTQWERAGVGFPEALMVDLEIIPAQRLLIAATHGLGIFYLNLQ